MRAPQAGAAIAGPHCTPAIWAVLAPHRLQLGCRSRHGALSVPHVDRRWLGWRQHTRGVRAGNGCTVGENFRQTLDWVCQGLD